MHSITLSNESLYRQAFADACQDIKASSIVDIGSWDGTYSQQIGEIVGAKTVLCVDHDEKALKKAEKRGCKILDADLNVKLKLKSNSFELALSNNVIEHIAKTDILVSETFRILKPGGISIWCTPNLASWHNIAALSMGYQPFPSQVSDRAFLGNPWHPDNNQPIREEQAHLRLFTARSLSDLLSYHGFTNIKTNGIGYYPLSGKAAKMMASIDPTHAAYILATAKK